MNCLGEPEYFAWLLNSDKRSHSALEKLVDDLHVNKDRTVTTFLCHSGSEDFLWGLVKLLAHTNSRVAGNAAYIIGTLAESELGCFRVLSLTKSHHAEGKNILRNLSKMLTFDDAESVMNAAGTLGTLAESHDGRDWIIAEGCLDEIIENITMLLENANLWTASNAALVLARLSIAEDGCSRILNHANSSIVLNKLVLSLGVDEAGRGMNAAFAVGRLCDTNDGRKRLLALPESDRMISSLARMLCSKDAGVSKNACFALSCLATTLEGHTRLLSNKQSQQVIKQLVDLLDSEDPETGWFAAMTLRTIAGQPKGCLKLRGFQYVTSALKAIAIRDDVNSDLKEEVLVTIEILKKLVKPHPPQVKVIGAHEAEVSWEETKTKSGFEVFYQLFEETNCVYEGKETWCLLKELTPLTQYNFKLRAYTEGDEGPFSEVVTVTTDETVPGPPANPRILGCTATQLKLGWDLPEDLNGLLKGFFIYHGGSLVDHTHELMCILTSLQPATSYDIEICAATAKGKGPRVSVTGSTAEVGAHAPPRPDVMVMGRNEIHVSWRGPDVPLGRITRYDLTMNNKTIYLGTDLSYSVRRLTPDTEYSFVVTALTSEGRFESKVTKKRTAKDEYEGTRAPLYQTPIKKEEEPVKAPPTEYKKRKSISNNLEPKPRTNSASSKKTLPFPLRPRYQKAKTFIFKQNATKVELYQKSSLRLYRSWTKIDLQQQLDNTQGFFLTRNFLESYGTDFRKRGSRTSPDQERLVPLSNTKEQRNAWNVDSSYPGVYVSKGSSSMVGINNREASSLQLKSKRSNSECFSKGSQLRDNLARLDKNDLPLWSKSVFPLNAGSLSNNPGPHKLTESWRRDSGIHGHSDLFVNQTGPGLNKSKTTLSRRDLEKTRPIRGRDKHLSKESFGAAQQIPVETPTWTPAVHLFDNQVPKTHNKFVPMQFRTQPANLSLGQLQRTNTQVLEAKGFGGMNLKRVENMSRSLSQLDMKSANQNSPHLRDKDRSISLASRSGSHGSNRSSSKSPSRSHSSESRTVKVT